MKTVYFPETIAAYGLEVCRCRQLIEFMNVCEYRRAMSFPDLGPRSFTVKPLGILYSNFICKLMYLYVQGINLLT